MIIKIVRGMVVLMSVVLAFLWFCDLFHLNFMDVLDEILYSIKNIFYFIFVSPTNLGYYLLDTLDIVIPIILIFIIGMIMLSFLFSIPGDIILSIVIIVCLGSILLIKSDPIDVLVFNGHRDISSINYHVVRYGYVYLTTLILMFIFKKYLDKMDKLSNKLKDIVAEEILLKCLMTSGLFFVVSFFVFVGWIMALTNINITCGNNIGILLVILSIILFGISLFLYKRED